MQWQWNNMNNVSNQIQVRYLKVWHWQGILDWIKTESSDVIANWNSVPPDALRISGPRRAGTLQLHYRPRT
jgi:hypothetical protein